VRAAWAAKLGLCDLLRSYALTERPIPQILLIRRSGEDVLHGQEVIWLSRYSGRRGEPDRAVRAAYYLACGFNIRLSLTAAGYSYGVASRGRAAIRHSQLLQRALRDFFRTGMPLALSDHAFCRLVSLGWPDLNFSALRTEYYGREKRMIFILSTKPSAKWVVVQFEFQQH
jgi:hypothetical protein